MAEAGGGSHGSGEDGDGSVRPGPEGGGGDGGGGRPGDLGVKMEAAPGLTGGQQGGGQRLVPLITAWREENERNIHQEFGDSFVCNN